MSGADFQKLDFDSMTAIAKERPAEFERLRREAIDALIASAPAKRQERLRRLQWRIDQERRNCTPLSACIKISKMMWDHLLGPHGMIGIQARLMLSEETKESAADIITFPTRPHSP